MENNIDKLFKSKLANEDVPYDPAAWGRMAALIDEDDDLNGNSKPKRKRRWKIYLGFALLLMISLIGYWQFTAVPNNIISTENTKINDKEAWASLNEEERNVDLGSLDNAESKHNLESSQNIGKKDGEDETTSKESRILNNRVSDESVDNTTNYIGYEKGKIINELNDESTISNDPSIDILNNAKTTNVTIDSNDQDINSLDIRNIDFHDNERQIEKSNVDELNISSEGFGMTTNKSNIESNNGNQTKEVEKVAKATDNETIYNQVQKGINKTILNTNDRKAILIFPFLETLSSNLENDDKLIIPAMVEVNNNRGIHLGLFSNILFNEGYINQTGINIEYLLKSGWSISSGLGFEHSSYNNGPKITVEDKQYSFGSTLTNRTITMNKRNALILPFQLKRSFNNLSVFGGVAFNYHIATNGMIADTEGTEKAVWVTNDVFTPLTMSYQIGASYSLNRRLELNAGLVYRGREINNNVTSENSVSKIYPSLGLNYIISKI